MNPKIAIAVLVGVSAIAVGCSRDPQKASAKHLANGDEYAKSGKFKEAAIEYRNAIKYTPQSPSAHEKLAEVAARTNDANTALVEYLRIAELDPGNVAAQVRAASERKRH
jgi:Tfp pilus assembly protein PilF